jgi:N-acylglucosamine-6-phosphate 2-epimerase
MTSVIDKLRGGLIVSCQAGPSEPLHGPTYMAAMARAAVAGGASGIRANGPEDIRAIRSVVNVPIIGIYKAPGVDEHRMITPTFDCARQVAEAGADIIALEATAKPRPGGVTAGELIEQICSKLHVPVMADVSVVEEALNAQRHGASLVATTLADRGQGQFVPDISFVIQLVDRLEIPVIAEGRYTEPSHILAALRGGAFAVVVGTAITRPQVITKRFVDLMLAYRTEMRQV